ncbi:NADH-quinone oxidoreductase subunit L [Buchnera aphidicola (Periphyllus koelreuteriae)]|uniref:NADH-quinone oxidoreductase subunit L n=1 Tax=Buchnera aphidicola TaxID=9 RepID=UPI0031B87B0B
MNVLFPLIFFPLISFLLIVFSKKKFSNFFYNFIGIIPSFICFILINYICINFFYYKNYCVSNIFWKWITINHTNVNFGFIIDKLSLIMMQVITSVSFLIQIFSCWYMYSKKDLNRFFAYMNLFIFGMIILVLSDNILLLYLAWELVGFCSYVLIGFYYKKLSNIKYSMKAFIVTRIGDFCILLSIFLIFFQFKTLNFSELNNICHIVQLSQNNLFKWSIFLILFGCLAKSSQFPLQIWLTKAMVGPTPVSALIHSATMITAGVYLILRIHFLFEISNHILFIISILSSFTILISSFSAIFEKDIKKILAYSTMSQIGYMFLGLGSKLWTPVLSHLIAHSFFKALLFLSSGSLIFSFHEEKNIFKIGGLNKSLLFIRFCFITGLFSLIAFPIITSSFYTKGSIIWGLFNQHNYSFFIVGIMGSFLTSIYSSRMFFLIFYKESKIKIRFIKNFFHNFSLFVLSILSTFLSIFLFSPLLNFSILNDLLNLKKNIFELFLFFISMFGVFISYYFFIIKYNKIFNFFHNKKYFFCFKFLDKNFGLDYLYKYSVIQLFILIRRIFFIDYIKKITYIFKIFLNIFNNFLLIFENGNLIFYIFLIFIGTLIIFVDLLI